MLQNQPHETEAFSLQSITPSIWSPIQSVLIKTKIKRLFEDSTTESGKQNSEFIDHIVEIIVIKLDNKKQYTKNKQ